MLEDEPEVQERTTARKHEMEIWRTTKAGSKVQVQPQDGKTSLPWFATKTTKTLSPLSVEVPSRRPLDQLDVRFVTKNVTGCAICDKNKLRLANWVQQFHTNLKTAS
ncbi:unnamed protein product [Ixodes pacificus]